VYGTFAALFHTLNHSLSKSLAFFSAGRLGQSFGSHNIEKMSGSMQVSPIWGTGIAASILVLIGIVPFSLFISEFQILKAAVDSSRMLVVVGFLIGTGIVFIGALRYVLPMAFGKISAPFEPLPARKLDAFLVAAPLLILLVLGVWMPKPLQSALSRAAAIIQTSPQASVIQGIPGGKP